MSGETEHNLSRERQERALADACADPKIAAIHAAMADAYSQRAAGDERMSGEAGRGTPSTAEYSPQGI